MHNLKADSTLSIVWWLWLAPAVLTLPLPIDFAVALCTRGLNSVRSSGIGGNGFALLNLSAVLTLVSFPLAVTL